MEEFPQLIALMVSCYNMFIFVVYSLYSTESIVSYELKGWA